jgi:hypothetical protein
VSCSGVWFWSYRRKMASIDLSAKERGIRQKEIMFKLGSWARELLEEVELELKALYGPVSWQGSQRLQPTHLVTSFLEV